MAKSASSKVISLEALNIFKAISIALAGSGDWPPAKALAISLLAETTVLPSVSIRVLPSSPVIGLDRLFSILLSLIHPLS